MEVYLVGGAVRDRLLGMPTKDKDFVVVGATPKELTDHGFIQVGVDFPVFLHPHTKQEYALARTERKSGKGYKGFEVYASTDVTLEQDLARRDLTINALAMKVNGLFDESVVSDNIIDPFGGVQDIKHRVLRHVSDAFSEDPLRVLRIARFYSRFYDLNSNVEDSHHQNSILSTTPSHSNFIIAEETKALIKDIVDGGELQHLTPERVWQETSRALLQTSPHAYFACLLEVNALPYLMPELSQRLNDPYIKNLCFKALACSAEHTLPLINRWLILTIGLIPSALMTHWFKFSTHHSVVNPPNPTKANCNFTQSMHVSPANLMLNNDDEIDAYLTDWQANIKQLSHRLKVPKKLLQLALLNTSILPYLISKEELSASEILDIINLTKAHKNKENLFLILQVHHMIQYAANQLHFEQHIAAFNKINMTHIDQNLTGSAIGEALNKARLSAINKILQNS